jgi:hypothetical protein
MQTFLPYANFVRSAVVLDRQRLGKQRVEAWQILRALTGQSSGWINHPATKMWRGYENELAFYGMCICEEWIHRGYKDSLLPRFIEHFDEDVYEPPFWLGDTQFHMSHKSNLLRKLPAHYRQYWRRTPNNLSYVWPVSNLDHVK